VLSVISECVYMHTITLTSHKKSVFGNNLLAWFTCKQPKSRLIWFKSCGNYHGTHTQKGDSPNAVYWVINKP